MRTRWSSTRAVFSAADRGMRFTLIGASMMFSIAVMWGKRLKDWKTIPTRVRSRGRFTPGFAIDSPSTTRSPSSIGSRPFTQRISVLLPDPDGPHTTTTSPRATLSATFWRTCSLPNHLLTFRKSIAGPEAAAALSGMRFDHDQHLSGVDRLAHLDADLRDEAGRSGLQLVLHLHCFNNQQRVPAVHPVTRANDDLGDASRHRRLEDVPGLAAGDAATRPDDVPGFLLDVDHVRLAVHLDDAGAFAVGDVGHVRYAVDEERGDALRGESRIDVPHLAPD